MIKFVNFKTKSGWDTIINLDAIDTVFPAENPDYSIIKLRYDDIRDEEAFIYVPYRIERIIEFLKVKSLCGTL